MKAFQRSSRFAKQNTFRTTVCALGKWTSLPRSSIRNSSVSLGGLACQRELVPPGNPVKPIQWRSEARSTQPLAQSSWLVLWLLSLAGGCGPGAVLESMTMLCPSFLMADRTHGAKGGSHKLLIRCLRSIVPQVGSCVVSFRSVGRGQHRSVGAAKWRSAGGG